VQSEPQRTSHAFHFVVVLTWGRATVEQKCVLFFSEETVFSWFISVLPGKFRHSPSTKAIIQYHPTNRRHVLFRDSSMAVLPFIGPWPLPQFRNLFYTDDRAPWTSDQPVANPLPKHRTAQTQNKRTHRHLCLEWDSNPRSQGSNERRQFMP
jgi:hypothetical protein